MLLFHLISYRAQAGVDVSNARSLSVLFLCNILCVISFTCVHYSIMYNV